MHTVDPAWVLSLMLRAEPAAERSPFRASYEVTADAFSRAATTRPLFSGEDGAEKTAALLVSVAWFESRFRQDAEGDHVKLADGRKGKARSYCALQIHETNFSGLGVSREALTQDLVEERTGKILRRAIDVCAEAGLRMMEASFRACRVLPLERRLDQYASGGAGCVAPPRGEGEHRVRKALALFRELPPPRESVNPG